MENYTEKIERYLSGEMPDSEKKEFEQELANNEELVKEIKIHKEIESFFADKETSELREKLEKIHGKTNNSKSNIFLRRRLAVAAGVVLLLGFGILMFLLTENVTNNELYNKYADVYTPANITRGDTSNPLTNALNKYSNKEFSEALELFKEAKEIGYDLTFDIRICLGITYTETGNTNEAVKEFENVISNHKLLEQQAQWYLGLTYLKADSTEKAVEIFSEISKNKDHYKNKEAEKIVSLLVD